MQQLWPHLRARSQITALGKRPPSAGPGCWSTMTLADLPGRMVHSAKRLPFRPQFTTFRWSWVGALCGGLIGRCTRVAGSCVCIIRFVRRPAMTSKIAATNDSANTIPMDSITPRVEPRVSVPLPTSHISTFFLCGISTES